MTDQHTHMPAGTAAQERDELLAGSVRLNPEGTPSPETARENLMKAIVQMRYGSPDVLQLKDIDKPVVKDDEVLIRVHAAAVNIGDWHLLTGVPYVMRLVSGLLKPRRDIPGLDIAGQVEVTGKNVKRFRPGR